MKNKSDLQSELGSFKNIWHGGFYEGDPLNPYFGLWGITSFLGVSHALYLGCLKPNVTPSTTVLEIGCGRGAWTRLMLHAKQIYCLDALSVEHNGFYGYVGRHPHVNYFQVQDFSMKEIPVDSIDFSWSYDALYHVSFGGISEYAANLFPRMRQGGHGIWMVADYEKYNGFVNNPMRYCPLDTLLPRGRYAFLQPFLKLVFQKIVKRSIQGVQRKKINEDEIPLPGRWYHAGTKRTCDMLQANGFTVVDADMGFDFRSPIIHFRK